MLEHRPFDRLGGVHHGWLDVKHYFSFAEYHATKRVRWWCFGSGTSIREQDPCRPCMQIWKLSPAQVRELSSSK